MPTSRTLAAILLATWASAAAADGRSGSFQVTVRVVAPLRRAAAPATPPEAFVATPGRIALPCAAGSTARCVEAAGGGPAGSPVLVTTFTDGSPTAIVER